MTTTPADPFASVREQYDRPGVPGSHRPALRQRARVIAARLGIAPPEWACVRTRDAATRLAELERRAANGDGSSRRAARKLCEAAGVPVPSWAAKPPPRPSVPREPQAPRPSAPREPRPAPARAARERRSIAEMRQRIEAEAAMRWEAAAVRDRAARA